MQRFKNILLVQHDSSLAGPAALRALNLTRMNRAKLTIIDVVTPTGFIKSIQAFSDKYESLQERLVQERQDELEALIDESLSDLEIVVNVISGKPFLEIIRYVIDNECDLVIKGIQGEKRFASLLFGSTDFRLLRKCPCPVWLVKPDDQADTKKILAAIELESLEDDTNLISLNTQIIEIASSLAFQEAAELLIVNAWVVFDGEDLAKKLSKHYEEDASLWVEEQRKTIAASQQDFRTAFELFLQEKGMGNLKHSFHFLKGEAEDVIVSLAKQANVDLVVMGTVARTDLAGFFVGNTSEAILQQIDASVLAVKPPGFVSPVSGEGR